MSRTRFRALKNWWWSVDNILALLVLGLILVGAILCLTASPAVAERLKIAPYYFVKRQLLFLVIACFAIWLISSVNESTVKKFALLMLFTCIVLMIIVLFMGSEVKGAKRWLNIAGVSIQPSEILKPFYFLITGLILSEKFNRKNFPGFSISGFLHLIVTILLILQPDFGMVITYTTVLASQFFLAGLHIGWLVACCLAGVIGIFAAYSLLPHVTKRIDAFLNPEANENYQIEKSLEAYVNGGILGKGPGEGVVKNNLPDSHTDFIFAVAGEEFGAIFSALIIVLMACIVIRGIILTLRETNLFKVYTLSSILVLFSLQTIFNIGVTLNLFPTKGMTLPFISYGGSSVISFAFAFGIILNLTKINRSLNIPRNYGSTQRVAI